MPLVIHDTVFIQRIQRILNTMGFNKYILISDYSALLILCLEPIV